MAGDLRVVELDFDKIKDNLKTFLKSQSYFTDYDFEGSALSILMDILAYDTHYKAYLANMVINERFIDTAVKRASVVSHAKQLGFVPRSARAAKSVVNVTVYGISESGTMTIDKYTPFTSDINGTKYNFVTTQAYTAFPSGEYNAFSFQNVELFEGTPFSYNHIVTSDDSNQLFKVPSLNVDTSTLSVVVQNSTTDTTSNVYTYGDSMSIIGPTDMVYYLQEGVDGYYYVYFGDGVLGSKIKTGNIVKLSYIVTNGSAANTSSLYPQSFSLSGMIGNYFSANAIIEVISPSSGGAEKQDIDEIRYLAPKNYSAQGRIVTAEDCKTLLTNNFTEIDSINVWGGEENTPPIYGRIFLSIKPRNGFRLTDTSKDEIKKYLYDKSIIGISAEFVDPDFTFITTSCVVKYNPSLTTKDSSQIAKMASNSIQQFFSNTLQQFNKNLYVSRLHAVVDNLDPSILGNTISIGMQKRIEPVISLSSSYTLYFNNKITPYSVQSTSFNVYGTTDILTVFVKDTPNTTPPDLNGKGTLSLINTLDNTTINNNIGEVDYSTGTIKINSLLVVGYPSVNLYDIRINCVPQDSIDELTSSVVTPQSVAASIPTAMKNQILMLDDSVAIPEYYLKSGLSVSAIPVAV